MTPSPPQLNNLSLTSRLKRGSAEHKGDAGKVVLIGGAPGMAGALLLAGNACMHLGAGWTILEMLDPSSAHACLDQPELMVHLANLEAIDGLHKMNADVIAIGPGLGKSALALHCLEVVLGIPKIPLVIDADAISLIASSHGLLKILQDRNQDFSGQTVLTPHPGEAAQLLKSTAADIQSNRLHALNNLVEITQSLIVLKGQHTLIASPHHSATQCEAGNPGMGTGGMGDVLTGSIAAIAAQGVRHQLSLWESVGIAVELHALAADSLVSKEVGPIGLTPSETILEMRSLLNKLL